MTSPGFWPGTCAVLVAFAPCVAHADGYFEGTKGARAGGRSGAFVARADDLTAIQLNPAGLGHLRGTLVQLGNRVSHNAHRFRREPTLDYGNTVGLDPPLIGFDEVENRLPWQLVDPLLGAASDFGLSDWRFGLAAYAPAGVGRKEFPTDGGQRYLMTRRDTKLLHVAASVAWTRGERFGVGASFVWVSVPSLDYRLVVDGNVFPGDANPVSSSLDMLATVKGSDLFTPNAVLGVWVRPVPFVELGASGQVIPAEIGIDGRLDLEPLAPGIDEDVILRRGTDRTDDVTLTLPLPLVARVGVRYLHLRGGRELFDVELDASYEGWSAVDRFVLDSHGLVAELMGQRIPIGVLEVDKRWRDTVGLQLGSDCVVLPDRLTARAGLFYESALARPAYEHVDFVGGAQVGGALGLSVFLGDFELAVAYGLRFTPVVTVGENDARVYQEVPGSQCVAPYTDSELCHPDLLGQPAPVVNAGRYAAESHDLALDLLWRF